MAGWDGGDGGWLSLGGAIYRAPTVLIINFGRKTNSRHRFYIDLYSLTVNLDANKTIEIELGCIESWVKITFFFINLQLK